MTISQAKHNVQLSISSRNFKSYSIARDEQNSDENPVFLRWNIRIGQIHITAIDRSQIFTPEDARRALRPLIKPHKLLCVMLY